MRKTDKVALVGWWPPNRDLAPWDDPSFEIWGVNEAASKPWMKRWDRWFQVHGRWNFSRPNNPNDPNHFEWLKSLPGPESPDFRPVYMQVGWKDIPASVAYPKDAVEQEFLKPYHKRLRFPEGNETGILEDGKLYSASSAGWMLGLALLEGFPEIHMYGFSMQSDTEYQYQRCNGEFWLGVAIGRKTKIVLPDPCNLLTASGLYGWEVTEMLGRQDIEFRMDELNRQLDLKKAMLQTVSGARQGLLKTIEKHPYLAEDLQPDVESFEKKEEEAKNEYFSVAGAQKEVANWLLTLDMRPTHPDFGKYVAGTDAEEIKRKEGEAIMEFARDFGEKDAEPKVEQ